MYTDTTPSQRRSDEVAHGLTTSFTVMEPSNISQKCSLVNPLVITSIFLMLLVAGCVVRTRCHLFVHREVVGCLKNVRVATRTEDVSLLSLPFRLVDGINPVLNLHNHASVLLDNTRLVSLVEKALSLLESGSSCL